MSKYKTLINPLSGFFKLFINSFLQVLLILLIVCGLKAQAAESSEMDYGLRAHQGQSKWLEPAGVMLAADTDQQGGQVEEESPKEVEVIQTLEIDLAYDSFEQESGWVDQIWGRPSRDHIYLGMWTLHLDPGDDQENNNELVGFSYKGYYGGTFINTHRDRVWSAGWQRTLFQQKYGEFDVGAGYRAGLMYGYKKYLTLYDTRFFPLAQAVLDIDYKGFGVELSWAGVVLTAGFYYRF
ncbi:hypothetical protein [Endozoicomonas numazuensis]|uniref:Uncharacterized protein n=1 Tax=Endozoicomonas numazuensis TaxID=1137799 RepID=A0A081NIB5_9GAMM|nr:hypothetical protein [Endozoicomonas numazuensis]KEQ18188.1 hypothetical protein GZ78_11635 [Endozoicomonas numazuensis]